MHSGAGIAHDRLLPRHCGADVFNDHDPPHFHIRYQGFRARVRIADGEIIDGRLPKTVANVLKEWTALRRDALMRNWQAARTDGTFERIPGLDDD
jgi:hypothetical protein